MTVSRCAARPTASRYRPVGETANLELGEAGIADRSSRPHHSRNQTPTRTERRIIGVHDRVDRSDVEPGDRVRPCLDRV
jgi:hypothetical protein